MSSKRDYEDVDDTETSEPESKRARKSRPQHSSSVDPNSGQKYVFASYHNATTIPVGEESDFEDDADAMAYLMSVRNQASGIPHILAAPKVQIGPQLPSGLLKFKDAGDVEVENDDDDEQVDRSIYNSAVNDSRGFYEDGAYIGRSDDWDEASGSGWDTDEDENAEASETKVVEAYFDAILQQYHQLRAVLGKTPLPGAAQRLRSSQATHADPFGPGSTTVKIWPQLLRNTDPAPLQLSLMSKDTVIRILRVMLGGKFLRRGHPLPERTSRWVWALLARLPERGALNYSEIGWVRDLGRRAVLLGRSLSEMAALRDELAEGGLGVNDAVDASSSDEDVVADEPASHADATSAASADGVSEAAEGQSGEGAEVAAAEAGEVDDEGGEEAPMDLGSDSDEGEIREDGKGDASENNDSLEAAKVDLLARLEAQSSDEDDDEEGERDAARERLRMNMRATLNMILTIAGEFYGQRDLLEFREPFVGM